MILKISKLEDMTAPLLIAHSSQEHRAVRHWRDGDILRDSCEGFSTIDPQNASFNTWLGGQRHRILPHLSISRKPPTKSGRVIRIYKERIDRICVRRRESLRTHSKREKKKNYLEEEGKKRKKEKELEF